MRPTTTTNTPLNGLKLKSGEAVTIRIHADTTGAVDLSVSARRADFAKIAMPGETEAVSRDMGQDILDAGAVQARLIGGEWLDIWSAELHLGSIYAGTFRDFQVKAALDIGVAGLGLGIHTYGPEPAPGTSFYFDPGTGEIST